MKKNVILSAAWVLFFMANAVAQPDNTLIRSGNKWYKQKQFDQSLQQYQKVIQKTPDDPTANYNLGNAQFRKNGFQEAVKSYQNSIDHADNDKTRENSLYNQGVANIKQQKLEESIAAWKDALKLDPTDQDARENLQKALQELKNKQQQDKKDDKKEDKKNQDKKENKDQKDQQDKQQPPPQSRLTKKQVEQLLKALQQKENDAQQKMNQNKVKSLSQPEKDW